MAAGILCAVTERSVLMVLLMVLKVNIDSESNTAVVELVVVLVVVMWL